MGQTMMVATEKAGNALRRTILLLVAAAVVAAMMSMSASPALADHSFDSNDFGDQELESGSIEFDTDISIDGNYNDQGVGLSQFANSGNFANQQGFDG